MANQNPDQSGLTSWKPGQSGNPKGKPKGRKNLSTVVRELMEDPDFDWDKIPMGKKQKEYAKKIGRPWDLIVMTAIAKSFGQGDSRMMEFLRKSGYGDKLDITTKGKEIQQPVIISPIQKRDVETETETAGSD